MTTQPDSQAVNDAPTDIDQQETREWMEALSAVIEKEGPERAHFLLEQLLERARQSSIDLPFSANTGYVNTLEPDQEVRCPGNISIEKRLRAYMRWNAMAMVVRANRLHPADGGDLGGHIGSFASLASMWGAGFNHFWHAESETMVVTAFTFRATARRASTPVPTWKGALPKTSWSTTARKWTAKGCRATHTPS